MHFICAAYTQNWTVAQQLLDDGFAKNTHYWQLDLGFMRSVLAPWSHQPTVIELLERIDKDRFRARKKFVAF
jgi:hypothetical protein